MRTKLPDQVIRLAVLFAIAIAALLLGRHFFVPKSFGDLGHYRADAVPEIAALPARYAGAGACADCHDEQTQVKDKSYHRGLSCEVCHGAAAGHAADPSAGAPVVPRDRTGCLYCHSYLPSRPTGFPQIIESSHNPMQRCISCHNPHDPTPPQVPGACSACHGSIARIKAISHHYSLACETCHKTPAQHRENPRAFLPNKPTERRFCGGCHATDASSSPDIPRVDMATHGGRYLCWQCHYPHYPETG